MLKLIAAIFITITLSCSQWFTKPDGTQNTQIPDLIQVGIDGIINISLPFLIRETQKDKAWLEVAKGIDAYLTPIFKGQAGKFKTPDDWLIWLNKEANIPIETSEAATQLIKTLLSVCGVDSAIAKIDPVAKDFVIDTLITFVNSVYKQFGIRSFSTHLSLKKRNIQK